MRILLVDDDLFAAELASIFLQMDGYDVVIVESAISALACLDSDSNIDLVISDLHMPEISGLDLLALLRAQDWAKPFILLSANEVTASDALYDRWVKKDENLAENLGAAVNALLQPSAVTE
ncbi:response regulator [Citrobacter freundii]|jgi:Response regulator containing CheY-like receiver, AAA-type ATPase, and DNA-binding domains|uniref:response regulator n=1 Tax=Citrobacter freundii TaxID=546 RepID=UPI0017848773|nr:response regulator [Citrobacter freundii]MBD9991029.1 response regulator transcription factor [Citrobacter freundii]MBE0054964.1 response regulator transcription factor [Citrobacter freundii]MDT7288964.1 response regulator [Citrobacter freundii]HBU6169606.1 response regulator [Citrobacter freundii]HBV8021789.1 response regulator [Citrobacter freundii]